MFLDGVDGAPARVVCDHDLGLTAALRARFPQAELNTTGRVVADQFRRRGQRSDRPIDTPLSTSPMDGLLNPIRAAADE